MTKLTGEEVLAKLKELEDLGVTNPREFYDYGLKIEDYVDEGLEALDEEDAAEAKLLLEELGETVEVANDDPNSEWDYYTRVINHFPKHDVYIETRGHYQSYVGMEFEDGLGTVVVPVQKTLTVYEEAN